MLLSGFPDCRTAGGLALQSNISFNRDIEIDLVDRQPSPSGESLAAPQPLGDVFRDCTECPEMVVAQLAAWSSRYGRDGVERIVNSRRRA